MATQSVQTSDTIQLAMKGNCLKPLPGRDLRSSNPVTTFGVRQLGSKGRNTRHKEIAKSSGLVSLRIFNAMVVLLVVIVRVGILIVVMVMVMVVVVVVVVLSAWAKRPATAKTLWPLRVNGEPFEIAFQGGGGNAQGCFIHGGPMRCVNFALLEFPDN